MDASWVICHFINHAAIANSAVGKSIVRGTLSDSTDKKFTQVGGWNESCNKETRCWEKCKHGLCCSSKFISTENAEPEMRGDEEVVMSSWAKEEGLMKWLECLEVEKGKIWAHNQRPWNQMQSYSMASYLHWCKKNSAVSGGNLQRHFSKCFPSSVVSHSVSFSISQAHIFF